MDGSHSSWHTQGTLIVACNCDYGCPCNFNTLPTYGHCEGGYTWHIEFGTFGNVRLDGLSVSVFADWPDGPFAGKGEAVIFIDDHADEAQHQALNALVLGEAGGPWEILRTSYPDLRGPYTACYELDIADDRWSVRIGSFVELEVGPVATGTGTVAHPRLILPEGVIFREGTMLASRTFSVRKGVSYEHPNKYAAVGRFSYSSGG